MRYVCLTLALLICSAPSQASSSTAARQAAVATLQKAVQCELPSASYERVTQALETLGAKSGDNDDYILSAPVAFYGLTTTRVVASFDEVETYMAIFPGAKLADVVAAAKLKAAPGNEYHRDTKHGRLSADIRDKQDVWLVCTTF